MIYSIYCVVLIAYRNKSIHYNCNFRMVKRHRKTRNHVRHIRNRISKW